MGRLEKKLLIFSSYLGFHRDRLRWISFTQNEGKEEEKDEEIVQRRREERKVFPGDRVGFLLRMDPSKFLYDLSRKTTSRNIG